MDNTPKKRVRNNFSEKEKELLKEFLSTHPSPPYSKPEINSLADSIEQVSGKKRHSDVIRQALINLSKNMAIESKLLDINSEVNDYMKEKIQKCFSSITSCIEKELKQFQKKSKATIKDLTEENIELKKEKKCLKEEIEKLQNELRQFRKIRQAVEEYQQKT